MESYSICLDSSGYSTYLLTEELQPLLLDERVALVELHLQYVQLFLQVGDHLIFTCYGCLDALVQV